MPPELVSDVASLPGLEMTARILTWQRERAQVSLSSSSYKDTSPHILGPHLYDSFDFN